MKVLLLLSAIPYERGEAIDIVSREVVRLMAANGHDTYVLALLRDQRSPASEQRYRSAIDEFASEPHVHVLPPIGIAELTHSVPRWRQRLSHSVGLVMSLPLLRRRISAYFFPAMVAKGAIRAHVEAVRPDVIASVWSWEALQASYDVPGVPKFVYYGNPDHKPREAQYKYPELFDLPIAGAANRIRMWMLKLMNRAREIQHVRMMNSCEVTANNALIDAEYYTQMGHPRSIYLQNMWPPSPDEVRFGGRPSGEGRQRVCASVGNLGATGNSFGLYYLGKEIAPRLEAKFGRDAPYLDVFGGGKASKSVAKVLQHSSIRMRGWVEDLNAEIVTSPVFLVLTNCYGFNVGNTRILLAWSLGACVVAHRSSALSMPEMIHDDSALLGDTADEIAALVARALGDASLRERIGRGGYEAFQKHYRSEAVVPRMLFEMKRMLGESGRGEGAETC